MVGGYVRSQLLFMAKDTNEFAQILICDWLVLALQAKFPFFPAVLAKNSDLTI